MLGLTVGSCFHLLFHSFCQTQGFGGRTLTIKNAFVHSNVILRSKQNRPLDDGGHNVNNGLRPTDQNVTDSLWLVGSESNRKPLTLQGARNIFQQQFQPTTTILSSQIMDEIEAMGGDPFFLDADTQRDEILEPQDDEVPNNENRQFGLLMDLALTSGGVLGRIDSQKLSLQNNESDKESDRTTLLDTKMKQEKKVSPRDILSQVSSFQDDDGTMSVLQRFGSSTHPNQKGEWTMNNDTILLDEIETMGGDPFFLDIPASAPVALDKSSKRMDLLQGQGSITSLGTDDKQLIDHDESLLDEIEAMGSDTGFLDLSIPSRVARDDASKRTSIQQPLGRVTSLDRDGELDMNNDENLLEEIEAMGGDPSFLDEPNQSNLARNEVSKTMSIIQPLGSIASLDEYNELVIDYDANVLDEIEAMGGDPFFLDVLNPSKLAHNEASETLSKLQGPRSVTWDKEANDSDPNVLDIEMGGDVSFLDLPDPSNLLQNEVSERMMLQRLASAQLLDQEEKLLFCDDVNLLDEIEAMGGDPSFLDIPNLLLSPLDSFPVSKQLINDGQGTLDKGNSGFGKGGIDWEWDGLVDEEAHLDIY